MKKIILFAGSILCLFMLCILSYQPVITVQADNTNYNVIKDNNVKNMPRSFLTKLLDLIRAIILFFLRPFLLPLYMLLLTILYTIFPH